MAERILLPLVVGLVVSVDYRPDMTRGESRATMPSTPFPLRVVFALPESGMRQTPGDLHLCRDQGQRALDDRNDVGIRHHLVPVGGELEAIEGDGQ